MTNIIGIVPMRFQKKRTTTTGMAENKIVITDTEDK